jgi:hypothetical protein
MKAQQMQQMIYVPLWVNVNYSFVLLHRQVSDWFPSANLSQNIAVRTCSH